MHSFEELALTRRTGLRSREAKLERRTWMQIKQLIFRQPDPADPAAFFSAKRPTKAMFDPIHSALCRCVMFIQRSFTRFTRFTRSVLAVFLPLFARWSSWQRLHRVKSGRKTARTDRVNPYASIYGIQSCSGFMLLYAQKVGESNTIARVTSLSGVLHTELTLTRTTSISGGRRLQESRSSDHRIRPVVSNNRPNSMIWGPGFLKASSTTDGDLRTTKHWQP